MADDELRDKLQQLHDEIEKADDIDPKGQQLLRDVDGHIQDILARSDSGAVKPRPALTRGLEDAVRHFEVTHPTLTEAISDVLTALSNAGI